VPCEHEAEEFVGDGAAVVRGGAGFLGGEGALAKEDGVQGGTGLRFQVAVGFVAHKRERFVNLGADVGVFDGGGFLHEGELAEDPGGETRGGRELGVGDGVGEGESCGEYFWNLAVGEGHRGVDRAEILRYPLGDGVDALGSDALFFRVAEHGGEDGVKRHVCNVVVCGEGSSLGSGAFELPQANHIRGGLVDLGAADLVDEGRGH